MPAMISSQPKGNVTSQAIINLVAALKFDSDMRP